MIKRVTTSRLIWIGLLVAALTLACGLSVPSSPSIASTATPRSLQKVSAPTQVPLPPVTTDEQTALITLYARVNPAVVNITQYGREGGNVVPVSQGSGFVYDAEGHVVTNAHVVHGSDQIDVTFADGIVRAAELTGEDLNSDLAVVKIDALPEGVSPLTLGDMTSLSVGQTVIAIGNPFGLAGTLTRGVISALGRTIPALTPFSIPQAIQTDAAINPGNSGGPLLNLQGEVIGVNAQIETGGSSRANSGVGFAIPVSIVKLVVPDLIEQGVHEWAWLGVSGGDLAPVMAQAMQVPFEKGAYLSAVIANGPADKAGLRGSSGVKSVEGRQVEVGGDIITAIDGNEMRSFDDMLIYIALYAAPGQEVELSVWRDGEFRQVKVTLEARPESMPEG